MKINLMPGGTNSETQSKIVYWLATKMADDYSMSQQKAVMYFVTEGISELCNWIEKQHQVKATPWKFGSENNAIGSGIELEESPELTSLLLKMPSGKLILKK